MADKEEKPVISAADYMCEDRISAEDVVALLEVVDNLKDEIEFLQNDITQVNRIDAVCVHINELSDAIFFLIDFTDTAMSLNKVSECLADLKKKPLDKFLPLMLMPLVEELESWLKSVFVDKTADNIYMGETMIIASSQQIVSSAKAT
mgnify:CR=1 FL=1